MITLQQRVHNVKPPKDWPINKLHNIFTVRTGNKNFGMANNNLLSLSYGNIIKKNIDTAEGLLPESFETYQIVSAGDIVMRLTDLQNDKRSLRQGLVKEKGIITSAYDAIYPKKGNDSRYWAYALLALDLAKYYYSLGGGVRQSIKFKDFPNDYLHSPPYETQKAIADFLDQQTARIDLLIEKKQEFLKVLNLRLLSYIYENLCGSNLNGNMVSSENLWLKKISENFKIYKLKQLVEFINGYAFNSAEFSEQGLPVLRIGDVQMDFDLESTLKYSGKLNQQKLKKYLVKKNDILIAMTGGTIGKTSLYTLNDSAYINQRVGILRAKNVDINYLNAFLMSEIFIEQVNLLAYGGAQPNISSHDIGNIFIPLPDKKIQKEIGNALNLAINELDRLKSKTNKSIEKLKELKTALITQAVTGELNIHDWQNRNI